MQLFEINTENYFLPLLFQLCLLRNTVLCEQTGISRAIGWSPPESPGSSLKFEECKGDTSGSLLKSSAISSRCCQNGFLAAGWNVGGSKTVFDPKIESYLFIFSVQA